jgi:phosphatidylethanolamine/phosphatidyl-N-methylethanolamine N-methyltransferase
MPRPNVPRHAPSKDTGFGRVPRTARPRFAPDKTKLWAVRLFSNTRIYDRVAGLYDASLGFWSREVRRQAAGALDLRENERLLIVGVGTGMELEHLPAWARGVGVDLSAGMLERARRRRAELGMRDLDLRVMDARTLDFPDESFEAVYLPLILTVVEEGARVFAEAARVARPKGRVVVADRFWPEERSRPPLVRAASWVLGHFAMRFDRRLSEIRSGAPSLEIEDYARVAPGAFFHLVKLRKPG